MQAFARAAQLDRKIRKVGLLHYACARHSRHRFGEISSVSKTTVTLTLRAPPTGKIVPATASPPQPSGRRLAAVAFRPPALRSRPSPALPPPLKLRTRRLGRAMLLNRVPSHGGR